MKIKILKLKQILVYATMLTTMVMYIPAIYNSGVYSLLRLLALGMMAALIYLTFSLPYVLEHPLIRRTMFTLIVLFLEFAVFMAFKFHYKLDDMIQLFIVFFMVIVGGRVRLTERDILKLCTIYCAGTLVLGLLAIVTYLGSFSFAANPNAIKGKNQVGTIVAVGGGIAFFLSQHPIRHRRRYLVVAAAIFGMLLIIRCRTALVAYALLVMVLVIQRWPFKWKLRAALLAVAVYVCFFHTINGLVIDSFFKSADLEDAAFSLNGDFLNHLSTNRLERNALGIRFLIDHPIGGELTELSHIPLIHNYVLLRLVRYGIFSLPLLWLYALYVVHCIRGVRRKGYTLYDMAPYILIIPMFCSLLEPSAPFGPGTLQIMPYLLCGIAMQRQNFYS